MVDPVAVVLLVAAGEAATPTTAAMARSTREALGASAIVRVRESAAAPTDGEALSEESSAHASAVAEVFWLEPEHRRARLRVHLARSSRWLERSIGFLPSDPPSERGRTLGFAVALIAPEGSDVPEEPAAELPLATSPTAPSGRVAPPTSPPASVDAPVARRDPDRSGEAAEPVDERDLSTAKGRPRFEIDLVASGATGSADGVGGGGSVRWLVFRRMSFGLGAWARAGGIDAAEASVSTFGLRAGIAVYLVPPVPEQPFGLALRADYLVVRQSATHYDPDDPSPVRMARWLSGFDGLAEGTWLLSSEIGVLAAVGFEDVIGPTYIDVHDMHVATIPALRLIAEAGFRLRF